MSSNLRKLDCVNINIAYTNEKFNPYRLFTNAFILGKAIVFTFEAIAK